MPLFSNPGLKDAARGSWLALGSGVAREVVGQKVNPSFAGIPIDKRAWYLDAGTLAVGVLGAVMSGGRYYEATEGALMAGLAYTAQDVAHEVHRRTMHGTVPTAAAPTSVNRVGVRYQTVGSMPGGRSYTGLLESSPYEQSA